jgi:hypothetical protein
MNESYHCDGINGSGSSRRNFFKQLASTLASIPVRSQPSASVHPVNIQRGKKAVSNAEKKEYGTRRQKYLHKVENAAHRPRRESYDTADRDQDWVWLLLAALLPVSAAKPRSVLLARSD